MEFEHRPQIACFLWFERAMEISSRTARCWFYLFLFVVWGLFVCLLFIIFDIGFENFTFQIKDLTTLGCPRVRISRNRMKMGKDTVDEEGGPDGVRLVVHILSTGFLHKHTKAFSSGRSSSIPVDCTVCLHTRPPPDRMVCRSSRAGIRCNSINIVIIFVILIILCS